MWGSFQARRVLDPWQDRPGLPPIYVKKHTNTYMCIGVHLIIYVYTQTSCQLLNTSYSKHIEISCCTSKRSPFCLPLVERYLIVMIVLDGDNLNNWSWPYRQIKRNWNNSSLAKVWHAVMHRSDPATGPINSHQRMNLQNNLLTVLTIFPYYPNFEVRSYFFCELLIISFFLPLWRIMVSSLRLNPFDRFSGPQVTFSA
jgi:hypothetical protein